MTSPGKAYIGTSGWSYPHWKGPFYPADLPDRQLLDYYCRHFHTVEVNNSFYHLPGEATLDQWRQTTPADFVFAAKASRYITHMKKLREPEKICETFLQRMSVLGRKLGPIVFQLPPHWHYNGERLATLLAYLPRSHRYAFEFRDPDWINDEALSLLEQHNTAFCIYELAGFRSPLHVTADFVYIRLHGPAGAYQGKYDGRTLAAWTRRIHNWLKAGLDVYGYFDNDEAGFAVENARDLQARIRRLAEAGLS